MLEASAVVGYNHHIRRGDFGLAPVFTVNAAARSQRTAGATYAPGDSVALRGQSATSTPSTCHTHTTTSTRRHIFPFFCDLWVE